MRRVRTTLTKKLRPRKFAHGELPIGRIPQGNLLPVLQYSETVPPHVCILILYHESIINYLSLCSYL